IEEPEYSFSIGYEHFSTTMVTELDEIGESSIKNLVPIPREYDVTSDNESEYEVPVKDDSSVFTTFSNSLFNDSDDFTSNDENVPIEESKVYSNPHFDEDEIYSDELESHVESNFVESLSNHDSLKFDHLEEFSRTLMPIHIAEEERIRREHAEYIRESDLYLEEIENFLNDDSIPTGIENSVFDPEGDILFLEKLLNEDPFQLLSINLNQAKSSIEEPEYSFSIGYEHFSTTMVTELDEIGESSIKNLVPIPREYDVTSDNESEYEVPVKDDSSVFTTFSNSLFNDSDDFTSNDENVPIEESKVYSNPHFD
nr:reverse transcriptase domain-containing protein [Tanacetum cinerariifolium]